MVAELSISNRMGIWVIQGGLRVERLLLHIDRSQLKLSPPVKVLRLAFPYREEASS